MDVDKKGDKWTNFSHWDKDRGLKGGRFSRDCTTLLWKERLWVSRSYAGTGEPLEFNISSYYTRKKKMEEGD